MSQHARPEQGNLTPFSPADDSAIAAGEHLRVSEEMNYEECQRARFDPTGTQGFYESYFQRANHPTRPLAFWIRYTAFAPQGKPEAAMGELWAIYFDGERHEIVALKQTHPLRDCSFSRVTFDVRVGQATLRHGELEGHAQRADDRIAWSLRYEAPEAPLLLLPPQLYVGGFPKAKSLVGAPNASYRGALNVNGRAIDIDGWQGSQNHNWGMRHTDHYAWGQVAGFDQDPHAFLECSTARVRIGPVYSPWLTLVVLRAFGEQYAMNALPTALRAHGKFTHFDWRFSTQVRGTHVAGRIHAPADAFVALTYDNPPGGRKICLNTKLAAAELTLTRPGSDPIQLTTRDRAAFEILSDDGDARVPLRA